MIYKTNEVKKAELLDRIRKERRELALIQNPTEEDLENIDLYDEMIQDLEYEVDNYWF